MNRALFSGLSGTIAFQNRLDVVGNNIANSNTVSYKQARATFRDALYQTLRGGSSGSETGLGGLNPIQIGSGVSLGSVIVEHTQGSLERTGQPLDVAIEGPGMFLVSDGDGIFYTRDGAFKMSAEGQIVNADGFYLYPEMTIPEDATSVSISIDGNVSVLLVGGDEPQSIGQFELARFINPAGLSAAGHNLYNRTSASGSPILGNPTQDGLGKLDQGYLEISNVKVVDEMVNMIVAQRAYELNSKVIQTGEDMLQISNNLKR